MSTIVQTTTGEPLTTLKHTCGDAAEQFSDVSSFVAQRSNADGSKNNVVGVLVTVETYDLRFAWGTNPTQAGVGHILYVGQSLKLTNHKQIIDFRFINKTNGENSVIQITPEVSQV